MALMYVTGVSGFRMPYIIHREQLRVCACVCVRVQSSTVMSGQVGLT